MGGMTQERLEREPLRWPCPLWSILASALSTLDHPSWYQAAKALALRNADSGSQDTGNQRGAVASGNQGSKRFLTPSGKVEIYTLELENKLATAGHTALPILHPP